MDPSTTIDRLSPTRRPPEPCAGYQGWRDLLFLHWELPAARLQRLLPPGLTLDTFEGRAFVGLVPFRMHEVRPAWAPVLPYFCSFPEVNLRLYVHRDGQAPGVFFLSLDAARLAAVLWARATWGLPYFWSSLRHRTLSDGRFEVRGRSLGPGREARIAVRWRQARALGTAAPGTLEHFLVERYGLYSVDRRGVLHHAAVHHSPYALHRAEEVELPECSLLAAAGVEGGQPLELALASPGVQVEVFPLCPVRSP
jgi:uncharacterized protein